MDMLNTVAGKARRLMMTRTNYRLWKANDRILEFQPANPKAKIVIAAMGPNGLNTRGKVRPNRFFPSFCRVLAQYGIASIYVNDMAGVDRELLSFERIPVIVIDLVNEDYDDVDAYDIPAALVGKPAVVFNSRDTARIIRDKTRTNALFSRNNVPMPGLAGPGSKKIFSNARVGSGKEVLLYNDLQRAREDRYNVEFVDTTVRVGDNEFYTTVRLMCIGSRLLQAFVRARDTGENNPSVHNADTPRNRDLLDYLYDILVAPRLDDYKSLARTVGDILGPGFYSHDILIDNDTGALLLCESGFKFFDLSYWETVEAIANNRKFQYNVLNQEDYARYAAEIFVSYCADMKFFDPNSSSACRK